MIDTNEFEYINKVQSGDLVVVDDEYFVMSELEGYGIVISTACRKKNTLNRDPQGRYKIKTVGTAMVAWSGTLNGKSLIKNISIDQEYLTLA